MVTFCRCSGSRAKRFDLQIVIQSVMPLGRATMVYRRSSLSAGRVTVTNHGVPSTLPLPTCSGHQRYNTSYLTPLTAAVPNCCYSKGSVPYWSNPPFLPERDYVTFGSLLSQSRLSSVVCLSVCNVGAPYLGG